MKKRQVRNFISLSQEKSIPELRQKGEDIIPPKRTEAQSSNIPVWPTREAKRRGVKATEDRREALLKSLFDANRHKNIQSPTFRYSREPVEQAAQMIGHDAADNVFMGSGSGKHLPIRTSPKFASGSLTPSRDRYQQTGNNGFDRDKSSFSTGKSNILIKRLDLNIRPENSEVNDNGMRSVGKGNATAIGLKRIENRSMELPHGDLFTSSTSPQDNLQSGLGSGLKLECAEVEDGEVQIAEMFKRKVTTTWIPNPQSFAFRQGVLAKDTKKTNQLWRQFREQLGKEKINSKALNTLFADFLWGFSHLRKMEPLQEVWSCMIEQGIEPTIRHWNAVLEVLQKTRDLERFNATWKAMLEKGIRPDNQSWTTHIVVLLAQPYNDWRTVMHLLDGMGKSWQEVQTENALRTQTGTSDPQNLPSIIPINAAVTGLLRLHLTDVAGDVLKWAQSFSIKIDTTCYNIFLRYACQQGDTARADLIIKEMEKNSVKQDAVTKTIMLDNMIRNPDSTFSALSPTEQEQIIVESLNRMSDEGEPPNSQTFAVALHALLRQPKPNLPAARAVFRLLLRQRKGVSPHIYTILVMCHFKSENPDLEALDSLWQMAEKQNSKIDHILYDRMIEGYAAIGELDRMLAFFKKMTDAGQVPGWLALGKALIALTKKNEWKLCAQLVSDVTNESGHLHVGKRGWKGEREFWQIVSELREQKLIPYEK